MSANYSKTTIRGLWHAIGHGAWMLVAVMGISALAISALLLLLTWSFNISAQTLGQPEWTLALYAGQYGLGLFVLLLVPVVLQKMNKQQLRELFGVTRWPIFKDFGMALLLFVPYFGVSLALQALIAAFVPGFNVDQTQDVGFNDINGTTQLVVTFIALVVLAPIAEELIFRGYLFGNARKYLGFIPAALITSVLFGLVHGQWNVGLDTFVLSMFLCYLRDSTGSIWSSVFLHAFKNGLAYFLLFITPLLGLNLLQ